MYVSPAGSHICTAKATLIDSGAYLYTMLNSGVYWTHTNNKVKRIMIIHSITYRMQGSALSGDLTCTNVID